VRTINYKALHYAFFAVSCHFFFFFSFVFFLVFFFSYSYSSSCCSSSSSSSSSSLLYNILLTIFCLNFVSNKKILYPFGPKKVNQFKQQ